MPGGQKARRNMSHNDGSKHRVPGKPSAMKPNQRVRGKGTWSEQARRVTRSQENRLSRVRGRGTLGEQVGGLYNVKGAKLNERRGGGTWSDQARRLDRQRRQRERQEKRQHSPLRWLLG